MINIVHATSRGEFRNWLIENSHKEAECWLAIKKGKTPPSNCIWYLDAVEEALCFGWIDTTIKNINGVNMQKFTPRRKKSIWSELNKERCRRLEKLGLMTEAGRKVLPNMSEDIVIDPEIILAFQRNPIAWQNFCNFPPLYQKIRINCIQIKKKEKIVFKKRLEKLIAQSAKGIMFGNWNDYGRLL